MAATFISALVIKHNNNVWQNGVIKDIPTPGSGGVPDGDFWAVPITDNVLDGFNFIVTTPDSTDAPTTQSFHVFKLTNRFGNDTWVVRGTTTAADGGSPSSCGYIQASADAECCAASPCQLPTDLPVFAACQLMCEVDADGKYFAIFALPTLLPAGYRYYPYGYFNNVLGTAATATGYATSGTLLSFLNAGTWGAIGTWSSPEAGILKVTQSAGSGTNVVCLTIITVNPSA